jgi:hypothetical protein
LEVTGIFLYQQTTRHYPPLASNQGKEPGSVWCFVILEHKMERIDTKSISYTNGLTVRVLKDNMIQLNIGYYMDNFGGDDGQEIEITPKELLQLVKDINSLLEKNDKK